MLKKPLYATVATALLCAAATAQAQQLADKRPDGPGKAEVVALCSGCHGLARVMASGYPQAYWHTSVRMMMNFGVPIPPEQVELITDYLAKNYPEKPKPDANIIAGPAQVAIKEWQVPTPASRPHDPLATRDGAIWYTGQLANRIGRVDPKTGQIREFLLKSAQTAPHGLVEDRDGNIFFTGNNLGLIGKLDPKTGNVTEYRMPDPKAHDPHSLSFAPDGMLFFTAQQSNMIGRLDPRTGEIKLVTSLTPRSRPYGILVNSKGIPHLVLFGTNKIARLDPKTLAIREYTLPNPGARPRRMAYDGSDRIYYADFARGMLGRLDPESGQVVEWPSPGGPKSEPYGIVFTKGAVWYSESGTRPSTIVRFDPQSEKFQTWVIPSGGYIVRKMDVAPSGNPVFVTSSVNTVGMVEIK